MDNFKKMIGEMKQAEQKEEGAAKPKEPEPDPNEMMKSGITRGQEDKVDAMLAKDGKLGNNRFLKKGNDGNYYSYGGGRADQKMDAGKLLKQAENQESAKAKVQQSIKDRREAAKPKAYETEDETFIRTMKQNELSPEAKQEIREKAQQPKPDNERKKYIDKFTKDLLEIHPDPEDRYFDDDALYDNVAEAFRGIGDEERKSIVADLAKNLEANGFVNDSKRLNPGKPQPQEPTVEQASDEELEDDYVDWYEYIYEDMPMERRAEILAERNDVPVERAKALIEKLEEEAKRHQETLDRKTEESNREQEEIDKKEMEDLMRKLYNAKATNNEEEAKRILDEWFKDQLPF